MLVSIYRVETPRGGCGPYNNELGDALEAMFEEHRSGGHLGPSHDDMLNGIGPDEHCGFATLEELDQWFDGYHDLLHGLGFIVAQYLVPLHLVRYGRTQAVFRRGDRFPVKSLPMK